MHAGCSNCTPLADLAAALSELIMLHSECQPLMLKGSEGPLPESCCAAGHSPQLPPASGAPACSEQAGMPKQPVRLMGSAFVRIGLRCESFQSGWARKYYSYVLSLHDHCIGNKAFKGVTTYDNQSADAHAASCTRPALEQAV